MPGLPSWVGLARSFMLAGLLLCATPGLAQRPDLHLVNAGAADAAFREVDRARRELQRQQRVIQCQNRVLAQQRSFASPADFLRAQQACATTR